MRCRKKTVRAPSFRRQIYYCSFCVGIYRLVVASSGHHNSILITYVRLLVTSEIAAGVLDWMIPPRQCTGIGWPWKWAYYRCIAYRYPVVDVPAYEAAPVDCNGSTNLNLTTWHILSSSICFIILFFHVCGNSSSLWAEGGCILALKKNGIIYIYISSSTTVSTKYRLDNGCNRDETLVADNNNFTTIRTAVFL